MFPTNSLIYKLLEIMNKDRYVFLRLKLLLKGFIPSLFFLFIPKIKIRIIFSSEFNLTYKHNSKFLFEYFIDKYPEKEIKFVINDASLRKKLSSTVGDYFIESETLAGIVICITCSNMGCFLIRNARGRFILKHWSLCLSSRSRGSNKEYWLTREIYESEEKIYLKLISFNFSYFFSTSELFRSTWAGFIGVKLDKIAIMGQARNDILHEPNHKLVNKTMNKSSSCKNVLYAPTWRPFGDTKLFPFEDIGLIQLSRFLEENNINVFLRLHPNFEGSISSEITDLKGINVLFNSEVSEINDILGAFDLLITDYSSIYVDFLVTHKPILFLPYDYDEYKERIGFTIPYNQYTLGPKPETQAEFESELNNLIFNNDYYKEQRILANSKLNHFNEGNCKQNADFIFKQLQ